MLSLVSMRIEVKGQGCHFKGTFKVAHKASFWCNSAHPFLIEDLFEGKVTMDQPSQGAGQLESEMERVPQRG